MNLQVIFRAMNSWTNNNMNGNKLVFSKIDYINTSQGHYFLRRRYYLRKEGHFITAKLLLRIRQDKKPRELAFFKTIQN